MKWLFRGFIFHIIVDVSDRFVCFDAQFAVNFCCEHILTNMLNVVIDIFYSLFLLLRIDTANLFIHTYLNIL